VPVMTWTLLLLVLKGNDMMRSFLVAGYGRHFVRIQNSGLLIVRHI